MAGPAHRYDDLHLGASLWRAPNSDGATEIGRSAADRARDAEPAVGFSSREALRRYTDAVIADRHVERTIHVFKQHPGASCRPGMKRDVAQGNPNHRHDLICS